MVLEINSENYEKEVLKSDIPVILDFWAEWCGPCRMMAPVFEQLSSEFKGKLKFGKVNVDENRNLAEKYDISSIPTLLIFKKSKLVKRIRGALSEEEIRVYLKSL